MSLSPLLPALLLLLPTSDPLSLFRQWRRSPSPELRIQAVRSLRGCSGPEVRAALLSTLDDDHPSVRGAARSALAERPPDEALDLAREIAALPSPRARREGVRVLLERREDPTLLSRDRDAEVRARALASGRVALLEARARLADPEPEVRALALECSRDAGAALRFARDPAEAPRIAASRLLADPAGLAPLLTDRSWRVRLAAVLAAERSRSETLLGPLVALLGREPPGRVRARAAAALESLTRAPFGDDAEAWRRWRADRAADYRFPEPLPLPPRSDHSRALVQFQHLPVISRRVSFVLDASRSMVAPAPGRSGKSRWELVRDDLLQVSEKLPADARFNVILFRTEVAAFRPRLVPASARGALREWIAGEEPRGWTNVFDALEQALSDDEVDTLYLLTDGVPSTGAEITRRAILEEIEFRNRFRLVQINCVQAGSDEGLGKSWRGFLDELAAAHDGVCVRE
jgi:HEAT repeat protein